MTLAKRVASEYILWFDDDDAADLARSGGKGANLSRLVTAGFAVPPGFCVSALAYRDSVAGSGVAERFASLTAGATDGQAVEAASAAAREMIGQLEVPSSVAVPVVEAYRALGDDVPVAIRSSATAEDLPEASFAGQQDTYLNIRGADSVLEHVRRCWASLWTARAVQYRTEHGFAHEAVLLAVVIQEMIESEVAGVMFTANPVSGRRDETVVNASYGLGEAVVSGLVTPDTFVVQPGKGIVRHRDIGSKEVEIVYAPGGAVEELPVSGPRATAPSMSEDQVLDLARLGQKVTEYYGSPQDVEWGLRDGVFYLLQSRPITTLGSLPEVDPQDEWTRGMFMEILPDAPSPAFCSVLDPVLTEMLRFTFARMGQRGPDDVQAIGVFYHQPYLNMRYIRGALANLPEASRERLAGRIANPFGEHTSAQQGRVSVADLRLAGHLLRCARTLPDEVAEVVAQYYERLASYSERDPAGMPLDELAAHIRSLAIETLSPLVAYDFLLIAVMGFVERLVDVSVARAGLPNEEEIRGQLMSGVTGNLTMQTNKHIWRLAQLARRFPEVADEIGQGPDSTVLDRVRSAPGGSEFEEELDAFLQQYGHREVRMDVAYPTWKEDPTPVLGFVRSYLTAEDTPDPAVLESALAAQRREAARTVVESLDKTASGRMVFSRLFRWALGRAEVLGRERDTMHFHWTASFPVLRRFQENLGERAVAAGHMDRASDIYCLTVDDMQKYAKSPGPLQKLAARNCSDWERDKKRQWPVSIKDGEEIFDDVHPEHDLGREMLRGLAGSPGIASGPVCLIRGPEEFGKLRRGDILVAPLTNPVWTPLFAVAGGVVTDVGGILSHGAIVAREYGIPAVLGVRGATSVLSDGQHVLVDGSNGTVTLETGP